MRTYSSTPPEVRFWSHVDKTGDCWLWTGASQINGYGVFCPGAKQIFRAHRYAWLITFGPIPDDLHVCHRCDVRLCVNPDHLFLGTRKDNMQDAVAKGRISRWHNLPGKNAGERHGLAKLTADQAMQIRQRHAAGERNKDLAAEYGVVASAITRITKGYGWQPR